MAHPVTGVPEGFDRFSRGSATVWVRPEVRGWVESILSTAPTLHAAAARLGGRQMTGRGAVYAVPTTRGDWVVRHFRRGGSVASLFGDRYLVGGLPRPFQETRASESVRDRDIPTPRVLAAAVYKAGPIYRGDLVTELVPDASELAEVLFDGERSGLAATSDRKEALRETGSLICRLAGSGVRHADLNAKNVLLQWSGGSPTAYVLDLDRCRIGTEPVPVDSMLQRLLRSLRKLERRTRLRVPPAEAALLVDAAHGRG